MRPDKPGEPNGDLFRSSLEAILDPGHELIRLAGLIEWDRSTMRSGSITTSAKDDAGFALY